MTSPEKLKKYQREKLNNFKKVNDIKINDNEIYITLKVDKLADITDEFCPPNKIILDEAFLSAILKRASYIPLDYPLVLEILNDTFTSAEKIQLRKIIKNHFELEKINKEVELKVLKRKSGFFLILSIIAFVVLCITAIFNKSLLFSEIISFIASFSVWEFFEIFLFEQDPLKEEIIKYNHLSKIRVVFNKDNG